MPWRFSFPGNSSGLLVQKFRRKRGVGLGAPGGPVIGRDGLAVAGSLAETDVPGNDGGVDLAEEVKHYFPGKVYATVIPRNVRLSEAPSHGKPINAYDRTSRGAEAYQALAKEFLSKQ